MACKGNTNQFCGGPDRLTLYRTGACQEQPPVEEPPCDPEEPPAEVPPTEEPPTEEPLSEEPPSEEPPTEEPPTEEPPTEEPPTEEPPTEEPPTEEPPTEEPPAEEPPTEEPPTEEPTTEEPPTEEPPTEEPPAPEPACLTTVARFNPLAVYKSPPPTPTPSTRAIGMAFVNTSPGRSYGLFSTAASSAYFYYALQGGAVLPKSGVSSPAPISYAVDEGNAPIFISTPVQPTGYTGYCAMVRSYLFTVSYLF